MDRRGAVYISRPPFPMTQDIVSGGGRIVLMPYDDTWRRLRKIMHQILSMRQATTYQGYQDLESRQLCWDYLVRPEMWFLHNGRYSNSGMGPPGRGGGGGGGVVVFFVHGFLIVFYLPPPPSPISPHAPPPPPLLRPPVRPQIIN